MQTQNPWSTSLSYSDPQAGSCYSTRVFLSREAEVSVSTVYVAAVWGLVMVTTSKVHQKSTVHYIPIKVCVCWGYLKYYQANNKSDALNSNALMIGQCGWEEQVGSEPAWKQRGFSGLKWLGVDCHRARPGVWNTAVKDTRASEGLRTAFSVNC